uniref:GRAM domain-containing protein n=1 Tax=Davidia involucrata TaxID=16924 RepID=A0A5B6YI39_DAVIN
MLLEFQSAQHQQHAQLKRILPDPATATHIPPPSNGSPKFKQNKVVSVINRMHKLGERADSFALGIRDHVRLGPRISETVKGKLSLGAKILQVGGVAKVFEHNFSVTREGEKLLKASQCYLSTTAGPIAGLLFISTHKVAFCSERSIKFSSPTGQLVRVPYMVSIPLRKIRRVDECENVKKPWQKYIEVVTEDNFDFWFMGFLNYQKTLQCLQQEISQAH